MWPGRTLGNQGGTIWDQGGTLWDQGGRFEPLDPGGTPLGSGGILWVETDVAWKRVTLSRQRVPQIQHKQLFHVAPDCLIEFSYCLITNCNASTTQRCARWGSRTAIQKTCRSCLEPSGAQNKCLQGPSRCSFVSDETVRQNKDEEF